MVIRSDFFSFIYRMSGCIGGNGMYSVNKDHALNPRMVCKAMEAAEILAGEGISVRVVSCSTVKPLDERLLGSLPDSTPVFTAEEHMLSGGFGASVLQYLTDSE